MKNFFILGTVAMITAKMFFLPIFIAAVVREAFLHQNHAIY